MRRLEARNQMRPEEGKSSKREVAREVRGGKREVAREVSGGKREVDVEKFAEREVAREVQRDVRSGSLTLFNPTRRLPMAQILQSLNTEWSTIADSPSARRALMRWSASHPVLMPAANLDDVLALGYEPTEGPEVRRALAGLAPTEFLAARTLLQAMLGGLCNLAQRVARDPDAVDDFVALAWERIRTYPSHRPGSVSGNILLDVRKRYVRQHDRGGRAPLPTCCAQVEPSPEDQVLRKAFFEDLAAVSAKRGVPVPVLDTVLRSRIGGESMADLAAEQSVSRKVLWHRRWRAEAKLRELPLAS